MLMRKISLFIFVIMTSMVVGAQGICKTELQQAIENQLRAYPASTLQDVYKAFYQEHFGPEHMITDTMAARNYLNYELDHCDDQVIPLYYEFIGVNGDYVRVYLKAIKDDLITSEQLLWAFLDSAKPAQQLANNWAIKWEAIVDVIDEIIPGFGVEDRELLSQASLENKAVHHSRVYNAAYHPHYRIVNRHIFDTQLKPAIAPHKNTQKSQ